MNRKKNAKNYSTRKNYRPRRKGWNNRCKKNREGRGKSRKKTAEKPNKVSKTVGGRDKIGECRSSNETKEKCKRGENKKRP